MTPTDKKAELFLYLKPTRIYQFQWQSKQNSSGTTRQPQEMKIKEGVINHHFATSRSVVWVASEILTELLNSAEKCANENYYLTFLVLQKFQNNFYTKNVSTFAFVLNTFRHLVSSKEQLIEIEVFI